MDLLKKFFSLSFNIADVKALVINIVIYIVASTVLGWIIGLLGKIPVPGILFGLIGGAVGLYATVGVVLALLVFFKVIK